MNTASAAESAAVAAVQQSLFVTVPDVTLPGAILVPSFPVGQYICAKGDDGKAIVSATAAPWVNINYVDSRAACLAADWSLITELQCLAIAHDIASVAANWTSGFVGEGKVFQGLHLDHDDVDEPYPGDFVSTDPAERRWHLLSNGEKIFDFAGNTCSWVFDNVQGDENGLIAKSFAADSPSLAAPYPSMEKGMGWRPDGERDWSGDALVRGGCWCSGGDAGVFSLSFGWAGGGSVGFRCTKPVLGL